jgi:hypothetical protein
MILAYLIDPLGRVVSLVSYPGRLVWESTTPDLAADATRWVPLHAIPESGGNPAAWAIRRLARFLPGRTAVLATNTPPGDRHYGQAGRARPRPRARTHAETRKDKRGRTYCIEPGQGKVPCPDQQGPTAERSYYHGPQAPGADWKHVGTGERGEKIWEAPQQQAKPGLLGKLFGKKPAAPAEAAAPEPARATTAQEMSARMEASPDYQRFTQALAAKHEAIYSDLAARAGMSVPQLKAGIARKAQALADSQGVFMRVRSNVLPQLLQSGRFKNQHETGKAGAGAYAPQARQAAENAGMGVPTDTQPASRPMYGYLSEPNFETARTENSARYQDRFGAMFKFKPHVRERATATFGDSLEGIGANKSLAATPLQHLGAESIDPHDLRFHGPELIDSPTQYHAKKSFVEVQIHDGLSLADVAEAGFYEAPNPEIQGLLKQHGIPWRLL